MDFTKEERIWLGQNNWSVYTGNQAEYSHHSYGTSECSFDASFLEKQEDGTILHHSWRPVNVDPDDGSYDTKHTEEIYSCVKNIKKGKPISKKEWYD
jgi:hypothetical protein